MEIRKINVSDAEAFLAMNHQLDKETMYMLFEPGERKITVEQQQKMLEKLKENPTSEIFVVDNQSGVLVGYLAFFGGQLNRNKHSGYIATGIIEKHRGQGLGKKLFQTMEEWAIEQKIERLELTVMKNNLSALHLYLKMGFEIEGVKRNSLKVNGELVDEYYMSKLLRA
ncbi:GNAT family N-acetyltransferase [Evansella tamaricis]|uniref:GNAT family N-acetyltransferase n=1 Tax=Evansella tamaricis TaxID=2069301 RepID=A0ABS6JMI7_9BACI|nr:GNAT family protein [Evansella tamaricis]MBU9714791.1 GNAT family N-acetyltransferase [Evansella tamaricis]